MSAPSNPKPKIWPSQRGIFNIWSENQSRAELRSPPLGISASHLAIRSRGNRGHSIDNSRHQSRPPTSYRDTQLRPRDGSYAWNSKVRVSFRSLTDIDDDDDDASDVTQSSAFDRPRSRATTANRPQSVHVPIKRINDLKVAISRKTSNQGKADQGISVNEERELVNRLCAMALKKRKKSLQYYQSWNDKLKAESKMRIQAYKPEAYKVPLNDLMLDLVKERETLLNTRIRNQDPNTQTGQGTSKKGHSQHAEGVDLPVYCIDGIVMLGKVDDPGLFSNTFAPIASLKQSHEDPSGYERFSVISDMSGFKDDEILIHANGNYLRFDGFEFTKSPYQGIRQRKVTENIKLPHGVYPERLLIGRNTKGHLVIQEKWKF